MNFPAFREQLLTVSSFLLMTLVYKNLLPQNILFPNSSNISCRRKPTLERGAGKRLQIVNSQNKKKCLRCNTLYKDKDNSPITCSFHGHTNGSYHLPFLDFSASLCFYFLYIKNISVMSYVSW